MIVLQYSVPFLFGLIAIESWYSAKQNLKLYDFKDTWSSISLGLGMIFLGAIGKSGFFLILNWFYQFRIFTINPKWYIFICLFIFYDFALYWAHRAAHSIRILWASHLVHHSSEKMNLTTAARQPWTESLLALPVAYVPLLGFDIIMIATVQSINMIYQFWIHTTVINKMANWFEYIFNTPSHHRVHHSSDLKYLDKNFGETFIIWDRIFGTFQKEDEPVHAYGLTKNLKTFNPVTINIYEWKNIIRDLVYKAKSPWDILNYLFGLPGWSNDGSSKTTKQLRKDDGVEKIAARSDTVESLLPILKKMMNLPLERVHN